MQEHHIELADMDAWHVFAANNQAALQDAYGSVKNAFQHAINGGLTLGGGAAPLIIITFAE